MTILVIDDNDAILVSLRYVLSEQFDTVLTLGTPDKILSTLQQYEVDVVLLDMNFHLGVNSGSEGLMWLDVIKRNHPDIPVVLMTAYGDIDLAVSGIKRGASDFVVKPWDNDKLLMTIRIAIEKATRMPTLEEVQDEHIRKAIDKCHGNLTQAAEILGVTRQTLYNKLKRK